MNDQCSFKPAWWSSVLQAWNRMWRAVSGVSRRFWLLWFCCASSSSRYFCFCCWETRVIIHTERCLSGKHVAIVGYNLNKQLILSFWKKTVAACDDKWYSDFWSIVIPNYCIFKKKFYPTTLALNSAVANTERKLFQPTRWNSGWQAFLFTGSFGNTSEHLPWDSFIKIGPATESFYLLCSKQKDLLHCTWNWGGLLGQSTLWWEV